MPVSCCNPVNILSWFNSRSLLCTGVCVCFFKRKPLACLCPCIDCQSSSCFLLVQYLITPLATFADIPCAGSGPINECEEPCLVDPSAISFLLIPIYLFTQTSWILLSYASFTKDWWQCALIYTSIVNTASFGHIKFEHFYFIFVGVSFDINMKEHTPSKWAYCLVKSRFFFQCVDILKLIICVDSWPSNKYGPQCSCSLAAFASVIHM